MDALGVLLLIALVIGAIFLYLLPAIVAHRRNHPQATAITILNIALGWTFLGWIGALVWANTNSAAPANAEALRPCPACAEPIRPEARKCRYCQSDLPMGWSSVRPRHEREVRPPSPPAKDSIAALERGSIDRPPL